MAGKTLCFSIYDFDRFSKHDQIGQVQIPFNTIDLGTVIEDWRDVQAPDSDDAKVCSLSLWWSEIGMNE